MQWEHAAAMVVGEGGRQALPRLDVVTRTLWTHQINGSTRERERTGQAGEEGKGGGGEGRLRKREYTTACSSANSM